MTSRWRRLTALLLLVAAVVLPTASASAQVTAPGIDDNPAPNGSVVQSWALFPTGADDPTDGGNRPNFTYEVAPGTTVDDSFTVANYGNVPLTLRLYASDAFNNADGGFDVLRGSDTPTDVGSWFQNPQPYITLGPGRQAIVPFSFVVPIDATPGDHVGAIVASQQTPGTGPDGKTVTLDQRTGSRVYLRVTGDLNPELGVENVSTSYDPKLNPIGGGATVSYTIVNRGNVRMKGTQKVEVGGPFGVFAASSTDDVPELLPGQSVEVTKTLTDVPATVLSSTKVTLTPEEAVNPADQAPPTATGSAWALAIPYAPIALVVIVGLLLFARHRYRRRNGPSTGVDRPRPAPVPAAPTPAANVPVDQLT